MNCNSTSPVTNADLDAVEQRMRRDIALSLEPLCQRISDLVQKQGETNERLQETNTQVALLLQEMSHGIKQMSSLDQDLHALDARVDEIDVRLATMGARQEGLLAVLNRLAVPLLIVIFSAYITWSTTRAPSPPSPPPEKHS